jgi:hypothetical protein
LHRGTRIIDHRIDSVRVLSLQHVSEGPYALLLADVQRVELDRRVSSIFGEDAGLLERWVGVQCFDGFGATGGGACG